VFRALAIISSTPTEFISTLGRVKMSRKLKKATSADDAFPKKFNNIHYERVEKYLKKVYDFLLFRISSFNSVCSNLELQLEVISSPKN
jgi:predicted dithiol-disulfide oxidoreductase (DUF899 family)